MATPLNPITSETPMYVLIIRAIHTRGQDQIDAIRAIERRGGWITDEQKAQAGLLRNSDHPTPDPALQPWQLVRAPA